MHRLDLNIAVVNELEHKFELKGGGGGQVILGLLKYFKDPEVAGYIDSKLESLTIEHKHKERFEQVSTVCKV